MSEVADGWTDDFVPVVKPLTSVPVVIVEREKYDNLIATIEALRAQVAQAHSVYAEVAGVVLEEDAKTQQELADLRAQVAEQAEWTAIDDKWFDFEWDINEEGYSDPTAERAYGYHVYQHPKFGQMLDLWVHGSLRATVMDDQGLRLQRKREGQG